MFVVDSVVGDNVCRHDILLITIVLCKFSERQLASSSYLAGSRYILAGMVQRFQSCLRFHYQFLGGMRCLTVVCFRVSHYCAFIILI